MEPEKEGNNSSQPKHNRWKETDVLELELFVTITEEALTKNNILVMKYRSNCKYQQKKRHQENIRIVGNLVSERID